jgi:hypothetical protein
MKSFKGHMINEVAWIQSLSTMLFDLPRGGIKDLKIPLSPSIFSRIWPKPIRSRVFHVTDYDGVGRLPKLQGRKKSISAFYNMQSSFLEDGIRTHGGYVVELDADVLAAAPDDISSVPDKGGTRWLAWDTIFRIMGEKKYLNNMEKDLEKVLVEILAKNGFGPFKKGLTSHEINKAWIALGQEYKKHKKRLYEIIKDFIDGVETVIRKHEKEFRQLLTYYVNDRHQPVDPDSGETEPWDELVVNNIKIIKIHVGPEFAPDFEEDDDIDGFPFKGWDDSRELARYIAHTAKKGIRKR